MAGYVKRIAVIKALKGGFSADGGELSGLVKAEAYAGFLKAEVSLINFAPLTEGRYVIGISDGKKVITFDAPLFEGEADFDLQGGFAAVICFCNNGAYPIASAYCGDRAFALIDIKNAIAAEETCEVSEAVKQNAASDNTADYNGGRGEDNKGACRYDDQAIAEDNYFEYENIESGGAVCKDKEEKADGLSACKDEEGVRLGEENGLTDCDADKGSGDNKDGENKEHYINDGAQFIKLAGGDFYQNKREIIENVLQSFPQEEELCALIQGSRWVKISYGENKYYVFGVIYEDGKAAYICYGVPSMNDKMPPDSFSGRASYIPISNGGYWVIYQDAATGASIKVDSF
jgi:hypothetical protein